MEIVVIVGQTPATALAVGGDLWLNAGDSDDIVYTTSRYDLQAVEEAIRIKETKKEGSVTLVAIGPPEVETALRRYLALGADAAVHICGRSLNDFDTYGLSLALSQAIRGMKYDLVLCGAESADVFGCGIFLGPYVAEMLGLPQVSGATKIELQPDGQGVVVHRKMEWGEREIVKCPLPCLLTIEVGTGKPRYPTLPGSLAGMRKSIQRLGLESSGVEIAGLGRSGPLVKVARFSPCRSRVKKGIVIETSLSAADRMKKVMSAGLSARSDKQTLLTGVPDKLVRQIVSTLVQQGIIRKVSRL